MHNYIVFATVCIYLPGVFTIHGRMPILFPFPGPVEYNPQQANVCRQHPKYSFADNVEDLAATRGPVAVAKWSVFFVGSCLRNFYFGSTKFKMQRLEHPT